jgi:ATP-dependent DNA ligase
MEAETAQEVPSGDNWQYEPKWDGFRCIAFREGNEVDLQSKSSQPLARYFPELVETLRAVKASRFVLDGEIVVPVGTQLAFDQLLQRIHPAESRIRKLSNEFPATLVVFDLLVDDKGKSLVKLPLVERRERLEEFASQLFADNRHLRLSSATAKLTEARKWLTTMGGGLDGIIAKQLDAPYASGERGAMLKIKNMRSADCVVGGFRYATKGSVVGSLLLGLYDDDGLLHHVGFTSGIATADKSAMTKKLEAIREAPGFTGRAPGGPSRWSTKRSSEWEPLAPKYVVEVQYDHFTGGRFRHGTKLLRWRADKAPRQCLLSQVERESRSPIGLLTH